MIIFTYFKQVVILALLLFFSFSLKSQCGQPDGTIIVSSTADEGVGTLRDAINCANILPGTNRIIFNLPSDERHIIYVGSTSGLPLPSLVDAGTIIDGSSQNGFGNNGNFEPQIILDGSVPTWNAPINALKIFGDNAAVYALEIRNFPDDGIDIERAINVIIGDEEKGNVIYNCGIEQDFFPETGNQGPFNGVGIVVSADAENTTIIGNIIGTDYNGTLNLGNEWAGIYLRFGSDFALIENNIITGNEIGIRLRNVFGIHISENELYCNSLEGIQFVDGANDDKAAPIINYASNLRIEGTGSVNDEIEVFIEDNCVAACQGRTFIGSAIVQNDRTWTLTSPFANNFQLSGTEIVTATATDANNRTSNFGTCQGVVFESTCSSINGIITVTNTNDSGVGSLRAAIECANATPGANSIQFNINGGGRQQINVGSTTGEALPFLRDAQTTLDATTQPGFGANGNFQPLIILDGGSIEWTFPHNAIWVRADSCAIYGLEVRNFPDDGIDVTGGDFNIIGAPNKGNVIYNCGDEKDFFEDNPGTGPWNGCGIVLKNGAKNTIIQSNIIGTDYTQSSTVGNELCGIIIQSSGDNNLIGGNQANEANIIAHNLIGINVRSGANNNRIQQNAFYCNSNSGISLNNNSNNNQESPSINIASQSVINGTGTNGDLIEVYAIGENCQDGPCQGSILLGIITVANQTWSITEPFLNNYELASGDKITALATSSDGNTSEFSACREIDGTNNPVECNMVLGISNFSNETCTGNNGMFTLSATNATLPISYDAGDGPTDNPTFSNLSAGIYNITATDAEACKVELSVVITEQSSPSLNISSTSHENCGAQNGNINLSATGGQSPYIFELSNGQISRTPSFANLSAGNYEVTVTDANNCNATQSVEIQRIGSIDVAVADMRSDNCNAATGSFRLVASGGQAPYTYDLGNGAVNSNTFTGLSSGNYEVTVADVNNCSTIANVSLSGSTAPVLAIDNISQSTCSEASGSVSLSVNGGTAPFQYNIGNGNTTNSTFSNLSAGNYIISVTDANNCSSTQAIRIEEPSSPSLSIISTQNASCGNANGAVSVLSTGGQAPYTYDIGWGISTNPNFNGLSEGNYNITVIDNNGCTDQMAVAITDTPTPTLSVANVQNASCNLNNAIITVSATGTAPFTYDIGNGPNTSPTFSDLAPGAYTVSVSDNNNCMASIAVEVESTGGPQVNIVSTSEAKCDKENGSIIVSPVGGFGPFTYDIGNGPTDSPEFHNLSGGNYIITLTDANRCAATQSVTLGNIPAPNFGIGNIINASCNEDNGSFTVSAFGGSAPYQFSIGGENSTNPTFSNLASGTYTVVVTDANNCTTALGVTVEGTDAPDIAIIDNQAAECGQSNGSFIVEVSGGISPYFYNIGDGETSDASFSNLSAGNYDLIVTDASGCSIISPIIINGNDSLPQAAFEFNITELEVTFTNTSQHGNTYSWDFGDGNNAQTTNTIYNFTSEGSYTVCLTANNDCGEDRHCKDIIIEETNTNKSFEFDFGEISGQAGDTIKIPVFVKNFNAIVGFQKSVHIIDTSVAKITNITDINLKDLSTGVFNIQDYQYTVSWFEGAVLGVTLPDSTIIYQIEVELLSSDKCTDIVIKDAPLPTQVYQKFGDDEIEATFIKRKGEICTNNNSNQTANITGIIQTEQKDPITQVNVFCTDQSAIENLADGTFSFENLATQKNYTIGPSKNINPVNGISTFDLVLIQNHILGKNKITSPYKLIAADVNQTGSVTVADVLELRRLLLLDITTFTNNESWRFIPEDYEFQNPENPFKEDYPKSVLINLKNKDISTNFIGIKIGDLNGNALPNQLIESEARTNKTGNIVLQTADIQLHKGAIANIYFSSKDLNNILGFQSTLHFDPTYLEVLQIETNTAFKQEHFGKKLLNRGYLLTSWLNSGTNQKGQQEQLFSLKIKAKQTGKLSDLLQFNNDILETEVYHKNGAVQNIHLAFTQKDAIESPHFEVFQNNPNPFIESTVIKYQLPTEGKIRLDLFDIQGRFIQSFEQLGNKGLNEFQIQRSLFNKNGLYYYSLKSDYGQITKKMLIIE